MTSTKLSPIVQRMRVVHAQITAHDEQDLDLLQELGTLIHSLGIILEE